MKGIRRTMMKIHNAMMLLVGIIVCNMSAVIIASEDRSIFDAVKGDNLARLEQLLKSDPSKAHLSDDDGWTPLHWAVRRGNMQALKIILKYSPDLNARDCNGETAVSWAICQNNAEALQALLQAGANPDIPDLFGRTPLHCASSLEFTPLVKMLINAGAQINKPDEDGETPLHRSSRFGKESSSSLLSSSGANLSLTDSHGRTAAQVASKPEIAANLERLNSLNKGLLSATKSGNFAKVKKFIILGAVLNVKDEQGNTPLHLAATFNHPNIFKLLVRHGASPDVTDASGETPLEANPQAAAWLVEALSQPEPIRE